VGTQTKITTGWGMSCHLSCIFKDEWAEMVREERTFLRKGKACECKYEKGTVKGMFRGLG
jgi:hypothetical protein